MIDLVAMKNTVLSWRVQNELSHCIPFCVVDGLGSDHVFIVTWFKRRNLITSQMVTHTCTMAHPVNLCTT